MMPIPLNDLARHTATIEKELRAAIERVLASGWFLLGPECSAFESEFAEYCGVRHCVGVGNGTEALELGFRALGLGRGCLVATVANAGFYTTAALTQVGATPIFVDVDRDSQLMDLTGLSALVENGKINAIVVTHLFGLMHDCVELRRIADAAHVPLIEDCAQAHGASRGGRRAGSFGDLACFSFYPTKNLGALGDAGAVVTNDPQLRDSLKALRQYGWTNKYRVVAPGGRNSRLDELQAAVLRAKLPMLGDWNARRRAIAKRYSERISHPRVICPPVRSEEYVAHLYVVVCDDASGLREHLQSAGIACDVHYPIPDHRQQTMTVNGDHPSLPVTEYLADHVLTLPSFPELNDDEVDLVIEQVNRW
jgi:dTDP-4-amino-4,6-dideoxygalactose transaminase